MKGFLKKINNNKNTFIFTAIIFLIPSLSFAVGWLDTANWINSLAIAIGSFLIYIFSIMLHVSAVVFDNMLMITLSTDLFNQDFIKVIWSNIRDIANIGFILGIIYIAFSIITASGDWKRSLIALIIVIFVINFSLFFARVIVDAGNITARVFVSAMSTKVTEPENHFMVAKYFYTDKDPSEFVSVAASFLQALSVEQLLGVESFQQVQAVKEGFKGRDDGEMFLMIAIVMSIAMFYLAKNLFIGGFMFLSRIVWIIIYMISAPIIFLTAFIPGYQNIWKDKWLKPLLSRSFCVVVYLFFIWVAVAILKTDFIMEMGAMDTLAEPDGNSLMITISVFVIKAVFVIYMLKIGTDVGKTMCEGGQGGAGSVGERIFNTTHGLAKGAMKLPFVAGMIPIAGAARAAAGRGAAAMARKGIKASESDRFLARRYGSAQLAISGSLENWKVGGKSSKDYNNEKSKKMKELREQMSNKGKKTAELRDYDIETEEGKDGEILLKDTGAVANKIESFVDPRKNKKWGELNKSLKILNEIKNPTSEQAASKKQVKKERNEMVDEAHNNSDKGLVASTVMKPGEQSFVNRAGRTVMSFVGANYATTDEENEARKSDQEKKEKQEKKKENQRKNASKLENKKQKVESYVNSIESNLKYNYDPDTESNIETSLRNILAEAKSVGLEETIPELIKVMEKMENGVSELVSIENEEKSQDNMKMLETGSIKYRDMTDNESSELSKTMKNHFKGDADGYENFMIDAYTGNIDIKVLREARESSENKTRSQKEVILGGAGKTVGGVLREAGKAIYSANKSDFDFQKITTNDMNDKKSSAGESSGGESAKPEQKSSDK